VQAKLDIYLWLGEYDTKSLDQPYLNALPPGFEPQYEDDGRSKPPIAVNYEGNHSSNETRHEHTKSV